MALIEDYKQCLVDIVANSRELEGLTYSKGKLSTQLMAEKETLNALQVSAKEKLIKEYSVQLERILIEKTVGLVQARDGILAQLQSLPGLIANRRDAILSSDFSEAYAKESSRVKALEDSLVGASGRFKNVDHRLDESIEAQSGQYNLNLDQMEFLNGRLQERFEEVAPKDYVTPIEKLAGIICWDSKFLKTFKPLQQVVLYTIWLACVICLTLWVPVLVILPYGIFFLWSIFRSSKYVNEMLNLYYPYRVLVYKLGQYKENLTQRCEEDKQHNLAALAEEEQRQTADLKRKLQEAEQQIASERQRIKDTTPEEELTAAARSSIANTLKAKEDLVTSLQQQVMQNQQACAQAEKRKIELENLRDKLKQKLTETYLSPKNPGDSKLIPESFFLGFDNEGALMEFNYEGSSTMVEYRGQSSSSVKDLIMMMVVQLLMAMDVTCISISFIDTDSGGFDYSVFIGKDLDSVFEIVSTEEDAMKLIESMHNEQRARSNQILTQSDSIAEYNKMMIKRKSFTKDYRVLLFQTIPKKVLEDNKFKQLCKNGPRVGIIPIVFMPQSLMIEYKDARYEERIQFAEFLESINSRIFAYDGATFNLEQQAANYRDILLRVYRRKESK